MAFQNYPGATATMTVTTPILVTPARTETVYSYGFEDYSTTPEYSYAYGWETPDPTWSAATDGYTDRGEWAFRSGVYGFYADGRAEGTLKRTFTDLTPGRTYTASVWLWSNDADTTVWLNTSSRLMGTDSWVQLTDTFTPTSSTFELVMKVDAPTFDPGQTYDWFVQIDDFTLTAPAVVHNNGLDGWTSSAALYVLPGAGMTGNAMSVVADGDVAIARAFSALTIGHQYTLRGKHKVTQNGPWETVAQTYTAASTAQAFSLVSNNPEGGSLWDDMELIHHIPAVYTNTAVLKLTEGDVTIDSGRYPYVEANVEAPFTGEDLLEQLEINQRITINATEGKTAAQLNLALRERTVSHDGKRISLKLASDEALLDTWADVVDDSSPRTFETNLRSLVNYVLGKAVPGAALQTGMANADLTATWDATNLQTNPSAGASLDGWVTYGGTLARLGSGVFPADTGIASAVRATMGAGSDSGPYFNGGDDSSIAGGVYNVRISGKQIYRVSAWVRTSVSKTIRLSVQQRNSGNTSAGANLNGPDFTTTANTWHRLTYVFQAYPESVRMGVYCYPTSGTWNAGQTIDITGVMVTEGTTDTPSFDGSTTIRTDLYAYSWSGTPHLSASKRTALVDRSPELFTWRAGESAWKFLEPLTTSAGLRLFCDEQRRFWLINPVEWTVPGRFSARPDNTVEGTDAMDADDDETGVSGVVTVFKWRDSEGVSREQSESAGVPGKVKTLEFNRPFTPGVAAAHLGKVQGQNRTQDVTVGIDYSVRPGQEVQIDLPGTNAQLGTLTKVRWELTNGLMSLASAQLRETPPGSIDLLTPTIDALPGTIDGLT